MTAWGALGRCGRAGARASFVCCACRTALRVRAGCGARGYAVRRGDTFPGLGAGLAARRRARPGDHDGCWSPHSRESFRTPVTRRLTARLQRVKQSPSARRSTWTCSPRRSPRSAPLDEAADARRPRAAGPADQAARVPRRARGGVGAPGRHRGRAARRRMPEPAAVAVFAADHGVHAQGVTPWPQEVTAQMVANFLAGGAVVNAFAAPDRREVGVVDVGVAADLPARRRAASPARSRHGTADMTHGAGDDAGAGRQAVEAGIEVARDLVAAGRPVPAHRRHGHRQHHRLGRADLRLHRRRPEAATGRGTGIDDATHARKIEVVAPRWRCRAADGPGPADPLSRARRGRRAGARRDRRVHARCGAAAASR